MWMQSKNTSETVLKRFYFSNIWICEVTVPVILKKFFIIWTFQSQYAYFLCPLSCYAALTGLKHLLAAHSCVLYWLVWYEGCLLSGWWPYRKFCFYSQKHINLRKDFSLPADLSHLDCVYPLNWSLTSPNSNGATVFSLGSLPRGRLLPPHISYPNRSEVSENRESKVLACSFSSDLQQQDDGYSDSSTGFGSPAGVCGALRSVLIFSFCLKTCWADVSLENKVGTSQFLVFLPRNRTF